MKNNNLASTIRLISASSMGTILEWYDFSLFAFLSPILAKHFFPQDNAMAALMLTYGVFAVGYLVRPLGAILFGHFGDRLGRKTILIWSILLMSLPTFLMGVLPTYAEWGIAAPLLLILLRVCQGISAGGETTGAVLFVLESVPAQRRGFMGGLIWTMSGVGMLLGSFAAYLVTYADPSSGAWRIPFLFGLLTGLIGYFLRTKTTESLLFTEFLKNKPPQRFPLWEGLVKYKQSIFIIVGLFSLSAMISYLVLVFMPTYATNIVGLPLNVTSKVSTIAYGIAMVLVPLSGYFSDRYNRYRWLGVAIGGWLVLSFPLYKIIATGSLSNYIIAELIFAILAGNFQGVLNAVVFELVPTSVRYSMIAVGYNISYSIIGGTAPFVATFLVNTTGNKAAPGLYLIAGALFALIAFIQIVKQPIGDLAFE